MNLRDEQEEEEEGEEMKYLEMHNAFNYVPEALMKRKKKKQNNNEMSSSVLN